VIVQNTFALLETHRIQINLKDVFMKINFAVMAVLIVMSSATHAKTLSCQSFDIIEGWNAGTTRSHVYFNAEVESDVFLPKATVTGAFTASADFTEISALSTSKNPRYSTYARFSTLEDAWCWYTPFLPAKISETNGSFTGFIGRVCEGNTGIINIAMSCSVK
jgi:hypothetical protein